MQRKCDAFEQFRAIPNHILLNWDRSNIKFLELVKINSTAAIKLLMDTLKVEFDAMPILPKSYYFNKFLQHTVAQNNFDAMRLLLDSIPDVVVTYPNIILSVLLFAHVPYTKESMIAAYKFILHEYLFKNKEIKWLDAVKEWLCVHLQVGILSSHKEQDALSLEEQLIFDEYRTLSVTYITELRSFFGNPHLIF